MDIPLPLPASSSHRTLRPGAFAQPPLAPASPPGTTVTPFAADPSAVMRSTTARGSEGGGRMVSSEAGERAEGMASLPRSASVKDGLVQSRDWAYEVPPSGVETTVADSRKGSDASWTTGQTSQSGRDGVGGTVLASRRRSATTTSTATRATSSSLSAAQHNRYPSSSTSLHPQRFSSLQRTPSASSGSATSADSPVTPALGADSGTVVYRRASQDHPAMLRPSLKGKERAVDVGEWGTTRPLSPVWPNQPALGHSFAFPARTSFLVDLASQPLVKDPRQAPSGSLPRSDRIIFESAIPDYSPSLHAPSPLFPTSPLTQSFEPVNNFLLPAFSPASARPTPPQTDRAARSGKSAKKRVVATLAAKAHRRRRSSSASSAASASISTSALRYRSLSLPNLRDPNSNLHNRRPSVPFEPRGPRTRSPQSERRSKDSFERGVKPIVFPSRPVGSARRRRRSPPYRHQSASTAKPPIPPRTTRNIIPTGTVSALTFAHPRVVVVDASPSSSLVGPDVPEDVLEIRRPTRLERGEDDSSVRRVLREIDQSRAERAAWSDSAVRRVGVRFHRRLAERDRSAARRDLVADQMRRERRRHRDDVAARKRREAATGSEAEDTDRTMRRPRRAGPTHSPPIPSSFEPFTGIGRKLSLGRSRERRASVGQGSASESGLAASIVGSIRRHRSVSRSKRRPSTVDTASTAQGDGAPASRTVRGQPIRHLHQNASQDSLLIAAAPATPPSKPTADTRITLQYGEAVSGPAESAQDTTPRRKPSLVTQNAFLSLPPHLHHLLRSPERSRFTPSRPVPPLPRALQPSPSLPNILDSFEEKRGSADSTLEAAKLSLALEEHLQKGVGTPRRASPVQRSLFPQPSVVVSRSESDLATIASSRSAQASTPYFRHPFASRENEQSLRRQESQLSQVSNTSSPIDLGGDQNWNKLFYSPPKPSKRLTCRLSSDSLATSSLKARLRLASVDAAPVNLNESPVKPADGSACNPFLDNRRSPVDLLTTAGLPRSESFETHTSLSYATAEEDGGDFAGPSPPSRPRATPCQTSWAATSFGRAYLGSDTSLATSVAAGRVATSPSDSFLRLAEDSGLDDTLRQTPTSFMDFSPSSSVAASPTDTFFASGLVRGVESRAGHLSLDSTHFVFPDTPSTLPPAADFPLPDLESASDGDDEREDGDESDLEDDFTAQLDALPATKTPALSSLPVVSARPVSSQSYLTFSDSDAP
ncbi:hypothetical protein NBRC10513_003270 [Rhodotorula toruloides]|uniref:Uncharacterized protein n=1 Tax=Rhodotorula toruloides TaxID=5286 RepID=A0A2S9ZVJ4_RHOTO|nr:hypothetical protein AAT19DRAFT_11796 [Rhodotorula toruloides]